MYWVEITARDAKEVQITIDSDFDLNCLVPILAEAGLEVKFGLLGSHLVIGGCLGCSTVLASKDLKIQACQDNFTSDAR